MHLPDGTSLDDSVGSGLSRGLVASQGLMVAVSLNFSAYVSVKTQYAQLH